MNSTDSPPRSAAPLCARPLCAGPLTVLGIDVTSAPGRRKPLACAAGILQADTLHIDRLHAVTALHGLPRHTGANTPWQAKMLLCAPPASLEHLLAHKGPWIAGFDMPFGLPAAFLHWWQQTQCDSRTPLRKAAPLCEPASELPCWQDYVSSLAQLDKDAFRQTIYAFMNTRPAGHKLPLRLTDAQTAAQSPLRLNYVPVGRMFHALVPLLASCGINIPLLRPTADSRTAIEVYPALAARAVLGNPPRYKDGTGAQRQQRTQARAALLEALPEYCRTIGGLALSVRPQLYQTMLQDTAGDFADALLCAVLTALAVRRRDAGMPPVPHLRMYHEGCIALQDMFCPPQPHGSGTTAPA